MNDDQDRNDALDDELNDECEISFEYWTSYASWADVQARMLRKLSEEEKQLCNRLLEDASVMIDNFAPKADGGVKGIVACRMVIRALGDGEESSVPLGTTQGSRSALGYSESWTLGAGGGTGELYLGKLEKQLLGAGNRIGSRSPVEELSAEVTV